MVGFLDFFTFGARLMLINLRQIFVKILIFHYFNLKYHIRIEADIPGYAIGGVFSQLILDNLGQWYSMTFFF